MADDPQVSFTVKEMLSDIKRQVDLIATALVAKADYSSVINVESRLDRHDLRLAALEQSDAIYSAQTKDRKYLYGAILTLTSVLVAVGGLILAIK